MRVPAVRAPLDCRAIAGETPPVDRKPDRLRPMSCSRAAIAQTERRRTPPDTSEKAQTPLRATSSGFKSRLRHHDLR